MKQNKYWNNAVRELKLIIFPMRHRNEFIGIVAGTLWLFSRGQHFWVPNVKKCYSIIGLYLLKCYKMVYCLILGDHELI